MKVKDMTSKKTGRAVPNQFVVTDSVGLQDMIVEYFQSYDSIIAKKAYCKDGVKIYLDEKYWNYSTTTGRYRNQFLGETTKETQAKIDSGEYILTDLN